MVMSGMRIDSAPRFALDRHLHLVGSPTRNDVAGKHRSIVFNYNMRLVAMFFMDSNSIETISILLKDKALNTIANDGINGQNDLI